MLMVGSHRHGHSLLLLHCSELALVLILLTPLGLEEFSVCFGFFSSCGISEKEKKELSMFMIAFQIPFFLILGTFIYHPFFPPPPCVCVYVLPSPDILLYRYIAIELQV